MKISTRNASSCSALKDARASSVMSVVAPVGAVGDDDACALGS